MPGAKTNERPGTRAVLRNERVSAYKVRPVLDLIRGLEVDRARDALMLCERDAALLVGKLLASAVANAENNDGLDPEELFVAACFADEGTTMKRWRPRARGRATRIRKRACHITVIVSRLPEDRLTRLRARAAADAGGRRRRVAGGRQGRRTRRDEQRPGTAAEPETVAATPPPAVAGAEPTAPPEVETRPPVEGGEGEAATEASTVEDRPAAEGGEETAAAPDEEKDS